MLFRTWDALPELGDWPAVTTVTDHVGAPQVVVSRHDLVRQVLADPERFRPDNALDAVTPIPVPVLRILTRHGFRLPPTLANNGRPDHPGIRAIVAEALHPDRVAAQREWLTGVVRRRVAGLAARLRAGEPVDLYAGLAADLPLLVLARLVSLPGSQATPGPPAAPGSPALPDTLTTPGSPTAPSSPAAVVKEFSRAALELFWAPLEADRQAALAEVVGRYHAELRTCAAEAGGMVGRLRTHTDAERLPPDTVVGALFFLLVAGQETTSQFLTLLLHRLAHEPAVLADLATGAVGVDAVVEEALRLEPPIVTWRRVASVDTTIGDQPVPAGASVVLWLARAGRDPAVAAEPDRFVPGQPGSRRHLAFGAGAHRCLGAQLARMEAAVVVAEVAPLLRGAQVIRSPWCLDNLSFRMPDALVIRRWR